MKTFIEEINETIKSLELSGFGCGRLTSKERLQLHNLISKSK